MKQFLRIDKNSSRASFFKFSTSAAVGTAAALILFPLLAFQRSVIGRESRPTTPQTTTLFAQGSFWYAPIPANVPLHPNSANFVLEFIRQKNTYFDTVTINTDPYASPVYIANAGTATVTVTKWDCFNTGFSDPQLAQQWSAVPIPSYAEAATAIDHNGNPTDAEMTIYQPSTNTIWEFWNTRKVNGQWQACWGGRMQNVSQNSGIWDWPYGATATGLPFLGGQITAEELQSGEITHVMGIALVDLESFYTWPANRSDGSNPCHAPHRIPEGSRFRLDPNVFVDALQIHPVAKIIAKAAQKYGFVVWDRAGAISLRAQNPKSYTQLGQSNPYVALFNGTQPFDILDGVPWDKLQFMPMDYGKPAPVIVQSKQSFGAGGGTGSITVLAAAGQGWQAASNAGWIAITSGASGSGNGTVQYSIVANAGSTIRNATIAIAGQTFTAYQGVQFNDVPPDHLFYTEIGKLSARGVTSGCGNGNFCPNDFVTREQMAAFIVRALGEFDPPTPPSQRFVDVPPQNIFYDFIDRLAACQITLGCSTAPPLYCPSNTVAREQMAAFLIRALGEFNPPVPPTQRFEDVPPSNIFYKFIDRMAVRNITFGCSSNPPLYCPTDNVTRAQMAAFMVRAFNL